MAVELRLPNINGMSEKEQLLQIRSYLYQLIPQLQWALNNTSATSTNVVTTTTIQAPSSGGSVTPTPKSTFEAIKSYIISASEIVDAYYDEINQRLTGIYVAENDSGTYKEETLRLIEDTAKGTKDVYKSIETIEASIEGIVKGINDATLENEAYIKTGDIGEDDEGYRYGVEIRQKTKVDGVETINKCARFTAGSLTFYNSSGDKVAWIKNGTLHVYNATIQKTLKVGGFEFKKLESNGLILQWVGD